MLPLHIWSRKSGLKKIFHQHPSNANRCLMGNYHGHFNKKHFDFYFMEISIFPLSAVRLFLKSISCKRFLLWFLPSSHALTLSPRGRFPGLCLLRSSVGSGLSLFTYAWRTRKWPNFGPRPLLLLSGSAESSGIRDLRSSFRFEVEMRKSEVKWDWSQVRMQRPFEVITWDQLCSMR